MHRATFRVLVTALLGVLILGLLAVAQNTSPTAPSPAQDKKTGDTEGPSTFSSTASEVILPVTVKDAAHKHISNLTKQDFRVLDEGRPQTIRFFSHMDKEPIVVGFLVDQGQNMRIHWDKFREAIRELVWTLLPGDPRFSGYLIQYNVKAELLVNTTTDSDKIAEVVAKMKPSGGSALFDAIYRACTDRSLVKGEPIEPRRIIIIIGDGHDTSVQHTMQEALEIAQRNLVTIYAMSTASFGFYDPDQGVLEKLAVPTGGHVEYPLREPYKGVPGTLSHPSDDGNYAIPVGSGGYASEIKSHIVAAVGGISSEITQQYILRYMPQFDHIAKPGEFRKVKVEVPSIPGLTLSYREGYYPNPVRSNPIPR